MLFKMGNTDTTNGNVTTVSRRLSLAKVESWTHPAMKTLLHKLKKKEKSASTIINL